MENLEDLKKKILEEQSVVLSNGLRVYSLIGKYGIAPLFLDDDETLKKYLNERKAHYENKN